MLDCLTRSVAPALIVVPGPNSSLPDFSISVVLPCSNVTFPSLPLKELEYFHKNYNVR